MLPSPFQSISPASGVYIIFLQIHALNTIIRYITRKQSLTPLRYFHIKHFKPLPDTTSQGMQMKYIANINKWLSGGKNKKSLFVSYPNKKTM